MTENPQTELTPDEAAILAAYRDGNGAKMLDMFVEKHKPEPLPDDYAFPHDEAYARRAIQHWYPEKYFAVKDYEDTYNVSKHIATTAIERIYAAVNIAGLDKEEIRLIYAYRNTDIEDVRHYAKRKYYSQHPPESEQTDDRPNLNFEQRMALIIIGELAKNAYLFQWQIEDSEYLGSFIETISDAIVNNMEHMDSQEVRHYFIKSDENWP